MDTDRLAQMEDVTRRYGRYRPCGAGLGVLWGGLLLGALGVMVLQWTRHEYAARAIDSQTFWRFLRDTALVPPPWLQAAAFAAPFLGWLGLTAIQGWVDRRFGAVTADAPSCGRLRGPRWLAPFMVALMALVLSVVVIWDAGAAVARGALAMLAIGGWSVVWGRHSRDQLTLLVMFAVSVPPLYVLMATDPNGHFASGNLTIFATYLGVMLWLLVQGAVRFSGFLKVRADLGAMQPADE